MRIKNIGTLASDSKETEETVTSLVKELFAKMGGCQKFCKERVPTKQNPNKSRWHCLEQWSSNCVPRNSGVPQGQLMGSTSHNKKFEKK
ncbi:hypothetical protein TNCV_972511 [Trichonephila clavipes]|nr:hypothetical protein TNCV_972511 [Trichonephila clavipes]